MGKFAYDGPYMNRWELHWIERMSLVRQAGLDPSLWPSWLRCGDCRYPVEIYPSPHEDSQVEVVCSRCEHGASISKTLLVSNPRIDIPIMPEITKWVKIEGDEENGWDVTGRRDI